MLQLQLHNYLNPEFSLFFCFNSVLVGATSDPSINIDDPISDEFFFLVWNETAKLNAAIYDKV